MSFKKFSASHGPPANDKPDEKAKSAPAGTAPAAQPAKDREEATPTQKA